MNRREILKSLVGGTSAALILGKDNLVSAQKNTKIKNISVTFFKSDWQNFPDMTWTGEEFWSQRLQDFAIKNGELQCLAHGLDRTVHVLTYQLSDERKAFSAETNFKFLNDAVSEQNKEDFAGFRVGIKGRFDDYRSAIMTGKGIDAGVTRSGFLFLGKTFHKRKIDEKILRENVRLTLTVSAISNAVLKAFDSSGQVIAEIITDEFNAENYRGNVAIVSHFKPTKSNADTPTVSFNNLQISGEKLVHRPAQTFGAIYFAQYTVQKNLLKLSAQFAPLDLSGAKAVLSVKKGKNWQKIAVSEIHPLARIAVFRVGKWNSKNAVPYRVSYELPLKNGKKKDYFYEGTIAAEPSKQNKIKALALSCNWDWGFPDAEVVENASKHQADLALFLGDQFYESNGGFGVQMDSLEKATLDYLRKWYQFGWSYRELFRHIPMVALLDDHDVYHGNIWGSGGRAAIAKGGAAERQDSGGYKMPPDWVNMAQLTQTSQMPDAFDAQPILQNIGVYYTSWQYGGIDFGIIEDRKFKSAPKDILPNEAEVFNGYAQNPNYNRSKIKALEAQLLGERQILFLQNWLDQKYGKFKVLLSATSFNCLQTLPKGTKNDEITPNLPIPAKGEYIKGDAMTQDMDSNGFPQNRRDEIVKLLGKRISLHLVGDQHLASVVQYGADNFGDGAFCFAVPALCNIWARRWHPPVDENHQPLPNKSQYTGNFVDGFGNKMTVHAAVSPHKTGKAPAALYDRATGYGVVEFDKQTNQITLNCFPRDTNNEQYEGFPLTIDNLS